MRGGFGPQDWDLGLDAGIWASRLRYGPGGGGGMKKKEEKEEKKKIPLCESIGHRPPRGRCPKSRCVLISKGSKTAANGQDFCNESKDTVDVVYI